MSGNEMEQQRSILDAPSDEVTVDGKGHKGDGETLKNQNAGQVSSSKSLQGEVEVINELSSIQTISTEASLVPVATSRRGPINPLWSKFTSIVRSMIRGFAVTLAVHAARNPKSYVVGISILSVALITAGLLTNFNVNTDEQIIYAPFKSQSTQDSAWVNEESRFPGQARIFTLSIHNNGDNILSAENIRKVFEIENEVRSLPGYDDICSRGDYVDFEGVRTCKVMTITRFFQHDIRKFEKMYAEGGEEAIIKRVSSKRYENLAPVDSDLIMGTIVRDEEAGLITSVLSFNVYFLLSKVEGVEDLEELILMNMGQHQLLWDTDDSPLHLEFFAMRSYSDEFARAIEGDLYLLPVVFLMMSAFNFVVFFRRDQVQSRTLLGFGAVITILYALMSSFGIMFIIGIPFTSMTQLLPFVVFGVGLDDTFIITGTYFRTDPQKDPVERVRESMEDIGLSISVTTITTMIAFCLGCLSSIPAIYWLNLYAVPAIAIDFVFQLTFFVGLMILDERRIKANRSDWCICVKVATLASEDSESEAAAPATRKQQEMVAQERFMKWYAHQLLRPLTKVLVIVTFVGYACFCTYRTTLMTQEFNFSDLLPKDSYVTDFLNSMERYTFRVLGVAIYFRGDFDQMDPEMQKQMQQYVEEISALPEFADEVPFCWFRDLETFKESEMAQGLGLENMTLQEQVNYAFTIPAIQETYGKHVVFDEDGKIIASRCYTYLDTNLKVVKDQIKTLKDQRAISARQPINQGQKNWSFFTFDSIYFLWEFYAVAVQELISTTISGVIAVCGAGLLFFPHWMAVCFTFPLIVMLYVDLLGTLQYAGLHINAVTYICLVISIGLMVDFILHVILRYYESTERTREAKVKDVLETIGASILVGGLSTALGVLPLALSTSEILNTVFISFFAIIMLGLAHGLVFLPVLLAVCGPIVHLESLGDTGDLMLKTISDTDESNSDDDETKKSRKSTYSYEGIERELTKTDTSFRSFLDASEGSNAPIAVASVGSNQVLPQKAAVLHSQSTYRDESLEVMRWNANTMAWI